MTGYTVISTMKNEGAFLLEWVAHHKVLGFDDLVICTNDCADHTRDMVLRLQQMGLATHHATHALPATSMQRSALKQARGYAAVRDAEWVYVCDADEFLVIKAGDGTARCLTAMASPGTEAIPVAWRIFGPDGQRSYAEGRITQQFTRSRRPAPPMHVVPAHAKTIFRGDAPLHRIGIHGPVARQDLGRDLMREMPGGAPMVRQHHAAFVQADYRVAQVNHYCLRSRDSFLVKRDRGRVNHMNNTMDIDYWDRFDVAEAPCTAIRRYDAATDDWLAQLLADPPLAALHHAAVAWHRARIATLHADAGYAALIAATEERFARCVSLAS
jgi:hypothetical protein